MLQSMKHLEEFTAENVYISALDPETFQFNPQLKSLTIGHTDLSDLLPELFEPIPNLQVLDLSESQIKSLDFFYPVENITGVSELSTGKPIIENITDAIYGSRKTICVITRRYLQSEWCSREIQMASFRLLDEQKDVLILIFLEDIPAHQLSPYYRMRKLLKKRSYLSWPQAGQHTGVFWQNVRRALEAGGAATETTHLLTGPAAR
ncbi:hypothetical protein JOQ06_006013 [Pogonophryne albipinna]|uniref:TIR domain-containing protein n=1 Tax=Pogonophryne albipinna TaxID=1090488 RepID=A0AAD6BGN5_9TELE|nr:hypothetical protein JOQ06_006013 [Pogonophryne albipinna]